MTKKKEINTNFLRLTYEYAICQIWLLEGKIQFQINFVIFHLSSTLKVEVSLKSDVNIYDIILDWKLDINSLYLCYWKGCYISYSLKIYYNIINTSLYYIH